MGVPGQRRPGTTSRALRRLPGVGRRATHSVYSVFCTWNPGQSYCWRHFETSKEHLRNGFNRFTDDRSLSSRLTTSTEPGPLSCFHSTGSGAQAVQHIVRQLLREVLGQQVLH